MKEIETDNNVGGKTPEEIKKGLKCFIRIQNHECTERCISEECDLYTGTYPMSENASNALALIEQLERKRDAALADLKGLGCTYCKRIDSPDESMCFDKCVNNCNWEWRGVKEEKDG